MDHRPDPDTAARPRLHALDNLRALMMWLGIVLHVAVIHMVQYPPLPWRDEQRTPLADLAVGFIHAFRMPVFFILGGYFVALLLQSRGPRKMAWHRVRRLGLPFLMFWPPLFVACVMFALLFVHRMARGTWGLDLSLMPRAPNVPQGPSTMHLWFLWLLLWLSLATAALASVRSAWLDKMLARAGAGLQLLGTVWWGFALLTLPLVLAGWNYPRGIVAPYGSFLPPWTEWLHNGLFFVFGLALYHQQWELLARWQRRWGGYAAAGLLFFLASGVLIEQQAHAGWIAFAYNACTWLFSFAVIGLGTRFLAHRSRWLGYLADSSYWVYLVHMPLTILFGAWLYGTPWPALAKIAFNIGATTLVCLATYQLFVRSTWVGALLNGRRHPAPAERKLVHVAS
jgi:glucan biosynthesis protein C